jgi:D-serine deaminase-like pyridoxal phosphate-dependent protein
VGVAGYEGALGAGRDAAGIARVRDYCQMLIATAALLAGEQLFSSDTIILSAGGGAWFDVVSACFSEARLSLPITPLIRSGAYMAHDNGLYARIAPFAQPGARHHFEPALEIWGGYYRALSQAWRLLISDAAMCPLTRTCRIRCGCEMWMVVLLAPLLACASAR